MKRFAFAVLSCLVWLPAFGQAYDSLNVYNGPIPAGTRTFYLAPDGDDANPGTEEAPWARIHYAVQQLQAGDVLVVRGGVYDVPAPVPLNTDGTETQPIVITAYPGEVPIFDFSSMTRARNNHGFRLNGDWWHLIGFTIRYAAHNGIRIDGSHNVLEQILSYENVDTGIHMAGGASYNLVLNSDSFRNFDPPEGGNADGFSAKFEVGPGNVFDGCRAWNNSDDGWDLWEAHNVVVINNSWAFGNGDGDALGAGPQFDGNGNGFKLGGGPDPATRPHVGHVVRRSLAFDNLNKGFDHNNNSGGFRLEHNTAFNNDRNFVFPFTVAGQKAVFVNNLALEPAGNTNAQTPPGAVLVTNSWQLSESVTPEMFESLDTELAKAPRNPDGSLPDIPLLKPLAGSVPVDAGVPIGEAFFGAAPDLGANERMEGEMVEGWIGRGSGQLATDLRVFDLEYADDWSLIAPLTPGADVFSDGSFTLAHVDEHIWFDEMIVPAAASRTASHLSELASFTLTSIADVIVAHADVVSPKPSWLRDAYEIPGSITLTDDSGQEYTMTGYLLDASPGDSVVLGINSLDGTPDAPMYLVLLGGLILNDVEEQPASHALRASAIYPNPVTDAAKISFELGSPSTVSVRVFDALGREAARVDDGFRTAGRHTVTWDAHTLPAGVYFVRLSTGDATSVRRAVVVR